MMVKRLSGIIAVLTMLSATRAIAQVPGIGFEFEPYGGAYIPTKDLVSETDFVRKHSTGLALGARATVVIPGPLAVEGNFMYAFSDVEDTPAGTETGANVYAISGLLRFNFSLPAAPVSFHVGAGAAYILRGGDAYEGVDDKNDIGGIAGVGMKVSLPGIFKVRADVEGYFYKAALSEGGDQADSQFQADIVLSAGLVMSAL
jgi:hypothetical protein